MLSSPYHLAGRQLLGHRDIYDGQLGMSGVGCCPAVAGPAALRNDGLDFDPLAALHRAECEIFPLLVGLDLQEKEPLGRERGESESGHGRQESDPS